MSIEEPEKIVHIKRLAMQLNAKVTIGWFYDQIIAALDALSASGKITFGNEARQVKDWTGPGQLYVIKSLDDAKKAIAENPKSRVKARQGIRATATTNWRIITNLPRSSLGITWSVSTTRSNIPGRPFRSTPMEFGR